MTLVWPPSSCGGTSTTRQLSACQKLLCVCVFVKSCGGTSTTQQLSACQKLLCMCVCVCVYVCVWHLYHATAVSLPEIPVCVCVCVCV